MFKANFYIHYIIIAKRDSRKFKYSGISSLNFGIYQETDGENFGSYSMHAFYQSLLQQ